MLNFIHQMRKKYDSVTSKKINKYVNTAKQIVKNQLGIEFIKTCLHHEKMPNFSRINLHSNDINNKSSRFLTNIRKEITNEILNNKTNTKYKKAKELTNLQNALFDLEPVDWIKLQQLVEEKKVKITTQVEAVHQKKLIALGIRENFNVNI